jgi:glycosyltransferase involved in cell wall biosynthesis
LSAGVSFVVPVHNGERTLRAALQSILAQADGRPFEVLVVDDRSTDSSRRIAEEFVQVTVLEGEGRGAAAAINTGLRRAQHPTICQVDQDVLLHPGWMQRLTEALEADPRVAAVQGRYTPERTGDIWARLLALDLDDRYDALESGEIDHVCSGNSVYRAEALKAAGLFDDMLGYGYDNDLSYRLADAGHRLAFVKDATSTHRWREGLRNYLHTQYGVGYGRLDVVWKHRHRLKGDQVSGVGMIVHAGVMFVSLSSLPILVSLMGPRGAWLPLSAIAVLAMERTFAAARTFERTGDPVAWMFPVAHLARDAAWAVAIARWSVHRLIGRGQRPEASMPRPVEVAR